MHFYQSFYYRFTCRFYFENGFQQVKAEYTNFKAKKERHTRFSGMPFLSVVDCTFYKSTIKSNCILLCNAHVWSSHRRCSVKKVFLTISQNSLANNCVRAFFKIKLQAWSLQLYFKKKALAQVLSCQFCEISKNPSSYRTPPVTASGVSEWIYCLWF